MQRLPPYVFRTFLSRFLENSAFGIVYKYIFMQSFFHSKSPYLWQKHRQNPSFFGEFTLDG